MEKEDDLFCRLAVRLGFVTELDVAACLTVQSELERPQRIGQIFVAAGLMSPSDVDQVLAVQAQERGTVPEPEPGALLEAAAQARTLGSLAVLRGLVTEGEVEECVFAQRQLAERGEVVPLGEVLVRKGYLKRDDLAALLALQRHAVRAAERIAETPSVSELDEEEPEPEVAEPGA